MPWFGHRVSWSTVANSSSVKELMSVFKLGRRGNCSPERPRSSLACFVLLARLNGRGLSTMFCQASGPLCWPRLVSVAASGFRRLESGFALHLLKKVEIGFQKLQKGFLLRGHVSNANLRQLG